ncbi:MAG: NAD(P)H-dependent oxidoreductase subunit E [Anderseniella sp.]|jgi:formate dehydrogenase|nr:NAD(P)H-dependent oxidoreductase subunit E [Anderseniella sp.]
MNKHASSDGFKPIRPGRGGKGKGRAFPKGRVLDVAAHDDIIALLAPHQPLQRDMLIEYLHLIQDKWGCLAAGHLHGLAEEMRLPQAEVFEVATFYHHFDVVKEGEEMPAEITIRVCDSLSCEMAGAQEIIKALGANKPDNVRVVHGPCMGLCDVAPAAAVGHNYVGNVSVEKLQIMARKAETKPQMPDYQPLDAYRAEGGYKQLEALRGGSKSPDDVIQTLLDAGLKGLGGAGFPSGQKWKFVRAGQGPRYLCINGDEGEPGTFKDRYYLHARPHQFLEGMLIAAWGVDASAAYIYLRDEYPAARQVLLDEIARLEAEGIAPKGFIHLRRGAGAYICGEESAMIESLEGKRGLPRHRPPYVAQVGLFDRPTLVHNIETVYWMPKILAEGPEWFASQGKGDAHKGPRSYSVSGRLKKPGVVLAPAGSTVNELIEMCGGMADGHRFKGYLPGGASGGILPASKGDIPLDFGGELAKLGCFVGSHAVVVLSDKDSMRDAAVNLLKFFEDESCGQCTPCRVGCEKAVKLMQDGPWDEALLTELTRTMADASICGLGQAAPNPIRTVMTHFKEDVS